MNINNFLGIFTLQFGVIILGSAFMTIGLCSIMANVFHSEQAYSVTGILGIVVSLYLSYIWFTAFFGAANINPTFETILSVYRQWTIFLVLWIALFVLSMTSMGEEYVCWNGRCPGSMWLFNSTRNEQKAENYDLKSLNTIMEIVHYAFYALIFVYAWITVYSYKQEFACPQHTDTCPKKNSKGIIVTAQDKEPPCDCMQTSNPATQFV